MKYITLFILLLCLIPFVGAEDYVHVMPMPEEFYGTVTYSDGSLVNAAQITVLDQKGKIIGNYNMTKDGEYGESSKLGRRLLVHAEYLDDTLHFYVGSVKSINRGKMFDSGEVKQYDVILPISAKPTPKPTVVVTSNKSVNVTSVITTIPTTVTPVGTVINNIPTQPTPIPVVPVVEDMTYKYIGAFLIIISLVILGVIIWYLAMSRHMRRDDEEDIKIP
jgi:hypothetical protein